MAKSRYKDKILEKLRQLHAQEAMLYEILKEVKEGEKEDGDSDSDNG